MDPAGLTQTFEDLTLEEREQVFGLVRVADLVLQPFKCSAEVKKFLPAELPALYSTNADAGFLRSVEQSKEVADPLWAGVLDSIGRRERAAAPAAQLCFNYLNPLVRRLAGVRGKRLLERSVQMLYVQALLLGHHPLSAKEMRLLNDGLLALIEWGVEAHEGGES